MARSKGCTRLTRVTIPNSVTNIGTRTFAYCTGLTNVDLGNSIVGIGVEAFLECISLASIIFPASLTDLEWQVFRDCNSLGLVLFQGNAHQFGAFVFFLRPPFLLFAWNHRLDHAVILALPCCSGTRRCKPASASLDVRSTISLGLPSPAQPTSPSWWKPPRIWQLQAGPLSKPAPSPTVPSISATRRGQIIPPASTASGRREV